MLYLSGAIVAVAVLAWLSVRDWLALQRQKHEDTKCRVVSAEEVAELRTELEAVKRAFNGLAMKAGISGLGAIR